MSDPLTLLCVHPHPDDESIACGGVLARAAAEGVRTVVVTCTGGEEGENLAGIDLGDEHLPVRRLRELARALEILRVDTHHWLGYRDSGMPGAPANDHPDSFHRADVEEAARRLAAVIRAERPQVIVSDDERGTYGHPDHVKAHAVTVRAVELAADPTAPVDGAPWRVAKRYVHTFGHDRLLAAHRGLVAAGLPSPFGTADVASPDELPLGTPPEAVTTEVRIGPWLAVKRAALLAHESQIGPDSFFLNLPGELATEVFGVEEFVLEAGPRPAGSEREADLFAGLRGAAAPSAVPPDPEAFRATLGRFATGVTVMTTVVGDEPHGMTANAVSSVSLTPPLVLVCVERGTVMADRVADSGVFALSVLTEAQRPLSEAFADPDRPSGAAQFTGVGTGHLVTGAPVLAGALAAVDCRVWASYDGGDHLIVVGEVVGVDTAVRPDPLLFFRSAYGGLRSGG